MRSFAIYRLPFAEECTMLVQHSALSELSSLTELNGKEGFVIAPFSPSADCPILLLQPEVDKSGQEAILKKLEIMKDYFKKAWDIDLDKLRDVVTNKVATINTLDLKNLK